MDADAALDRLREILRGMGSVLVAFSGGADSTFLLRVARDVLGDRVLAVTASSPTFPASEREDAVRTAREMGVRHIVIETDELSLPEFASNPSDRCYHCKRELFGKLAALAAKEGFVFVADGTNADDLRDFRPGRRALEEMGVRSPLLETGLTKREIRELAKRLGLPTWDRPAAACLASRIPYGERITPERLSQVERAESLLRGMGFRTVRVRHHGAVARIELAPEEIARAVGEDLRARIAENLKSLGFTYVALDLSGYRTGSMNEALSERPGSPPVPPVRPRGAGERERESRG